jgi:type VI secretion system secreted protein VgrG
MIKPPSPNCRRRPTSKTAAWSPTRVSRCDYDFENPRLLLESAAKGSAQPDLEDYDYPGSFVTRLRGKHLSQRALERHRADYQQANAQSDQHLLVSGHFLPLTAHPRNDWNQLWLLTAVEHEGKQPQVLEESVSHHTAADDGFTQGYRNRLIATPWTVIHRPPLKHPKPKVLGSQTAKVTGPAGEEIHCDQYGRIKVQFHWDREGQADEHTSCWLRVASSWAGDRYGAIAIPRIGMEVLVTFLEGDPDQPLVTGCLYHQEHVVPYPLPANKTRAGFKTLSSLGGGGYNEIRIEDRKGAEQIYLHAQRDWDENIEHDQKIRVGNQRHDTVEANSYSQFQAEEHRTTHLERKVEVRANDHLTVADKQHLKIGTGQFVEAGNEIHYYAGNKVVLDAGMELTAKGGGSFLKLDPGGVTLSGATIKINSGGAAGKGSGIKILGPILPGAAALALAGNLLKAPSGNTLALEPDEEELEEEEEEEELEEDTPVAITLRIGVFFDGTGNNKGNSETVAACYAPDVNLEDAAEDIRAHCAAYGKGSSPDSSYGNDVSNVVRLYELYTDLSDKALPTNASEASIAVYVEGIGTTTGKDDDVLLGQGLGIGETGVAARVEQSPALIIEQLRKLRRNNPELIIERIEFDIFGFSRGAAAARHFANALLKGPDGSLVKELAAGTTGLSAGFTWQPKTDLSINFIGLFDTVAAISNPALFDYSGANAYNPGIDLCLTADCAKKVVHLVARDEIRHNFALNSAGSTDIRLPGVHSDIGGGYLPRATEKLLLSRPRHSKIGIRVPAVSSPANVFTTSQQTTWLNKDLLGAATPGATINVALWDTKVEYKKNDDPLKRGPQKRVYAAVSMQRSVRGELSLVYLRIMRELAVKHEVPFLAIRQDTQALALPEELKPIAAKLQAFALGDSPNAGLTPSEETLLRHRYIHQSAHWNAAKGRNNSDLEVVFINRPNDNNKRVVHPNE